MSFKHKTVVRLSGVTLGFVSELIVPSTKVNVAGKNSKETALAKAISWIN